MKIDNNYSIQIIPSNVVLTYTGEPYVRNVKGEDQLVTPTDEWYYGSVSQALIKYVELSLSSAAGETETVIGLLDKIDELKLTIKHLK